MPLSTLQILERVRRHPDNAVIRDMLVDSISPRQKEAYYFVGKGKKVSTSEIAKEFEISVPNAGNLMLSLLSYELVKREPARDEHGLFYYWSIR